MDKVILHSDLNSFYANIECLYNPEIRNKPVAVCGDPKSRGGIILAKNFHAKKYKIRTGEPIWEAKNKCADLILVPANLPLYVKFSKLVKDIYREYSDKVQSFGIDEAWIDITDSIKLFGSPEKIANEIKDRVLFELGVTVSIGVSYNKVFAKLGSDSAEPNSVCVISKENYKQTAWSLPVSNLLYVGRSTTKKMKSYGINTLGDLANFPIEALKKNLGSWGLTLHQYANGEDPSPVTLNGEDDYVKSIGNSTTSPRDMENLNDVKLVLYMLSESVATRLRESGFKCRGLQVYIRDKSLVSCDRQGKFMTPTFLSSEIAEKAFQIFKTGYDFNSPLRSVGVRAINLIAENASYQLNLFNDDEKRQKQESLEKTVDSLRDRFGYSSVQKGIILTDKKLAGRSIKDDHVLCAFSHLTTN